MGAGLSVDSQQGIGGTSRLSSTYMRRYLIEMSEIDGVARQPLVLAIFLPMPSSLFCLPPPIKTNLHDFIRNPFECPVLFRKTRVFPDSCSCRRSAWKGRRPGHREQSAIVTAGARRARYHPSDTEDNNHAANDVHRRRRRSVNRQNHRRLNHCILPPSRP